ncbi:MAG: sulfotransferase [Pseudomonadota bacterium]
MDPTRLIFLGGSPRSGTTLAQNMLDSHPDVLGGPEFLHLRDIVDLRRKLSISVTKEWITLFCDQAAVDAQVRGMILNFLLPFADRHDAQRLSEKTPENVLVFPELLELLPESYFVFVVRDPRATVASQLSVGKRAVAKGEKPAYFTKDVSASVRFVRQCLAAGFRAVEKAPDRVYVLVYERLVNDPEGEGRRLCEFLGLPWDEQMLRPGEQSHLGEAAITTNSQEIWYDKDTYYSNPNTASLEKWREQLSAAQQLVINKEFRGMKPLAALGYDFSDATSGLGAEFARRRITLKDRALVRLRKLLEVPQA